MVWNSSDRAWVASRITGEMFHMLENMRIAGDIDSFSAGVSSHGEMPEYILVGASARAGVIEAIGHVGVDVLYTMSRNDDLTAMRKTAEGVIDRIKESLAKEGDDD